MGNESQAGHAGRYDAEAMRVLVEQDAKVVVLVVMEGKLGFGLSVSVRPEAATAVYGAKLAAILHAVADQIGGGAPPDGVRLTYR